MFENNCPLCKLCRGDIKTKLHYQNDAIIIVDCLTHNNTPIVVLKDHKEKISEQEFHYIQNLCKKLFPKKRFRSTGMAKIKDHWHEHLI